MSEPRVRLLIVEDEADIRRFLRLALENEGFETYEAETVKPRPDRGRRAYELVVLDLGLPDGDGVDFIRDLRGWSARPGAFRAQQQKPTRSPRSMPGPTITWSNPSARANSSHVRASCCPGYASGERRGRGTLRGGARRPRPPQRRTGRRPGCLTPIEYRLLTSLLAQPDRVLTHRQLLLAVWGPGARRDTITCACWPTCARNWRPVRPVHHRLKTEAGIGYRFVGA